MRITFVAAVFPPEPEPTSVMAGELARAWARQGHEVHVICPVPNRPGGVWYPGHSRRLFQRFASDGFHGTRVLAWPIGPRRRALARLLENATFGLLSTLALLFGPRPDMVLCESWPILATLPIVLLARARGIPVVNYIKDVYPEAVIAAHLIPAHGLVAHALLRLDRWACHAATLNLLISERMARHVADTRHLPANRTAVLHDWLDLGFMQPGSDRLAWRTEAGLPADAFVCLFAGTLGHASNADVLVEVARILREHPDVILVCVGEGILKESMQARATELGLANLRFFPFQPRARVPDVQAAADVMLLPTAAATGVSSVPSKLITYLAMARPVVCAVAPDSDIADLVRSTGIGRVVTPESAPEIAAAILDLRALPPAQRRSMGDLARTVALERHSLASALTRFDALLARLVASAPRSPAA